MKENNEAINKLEITFDKEKEQLKDNYEKQIIVIKEDNNKINTALKNNIKQLKSNKEMIINKYEDLTKKLQDESIQYMVENMVNTVCYDKAAIDLSVMFINKNKNNSNNMDKELNNSKKNLTLKVKELEKIKKELEELKQESEKNKKENEELKQELEKNKKELEDIKNTNELKEPVIVKEIIGDEAVPTFNNIDSEEIPKIKAELESKNKEFNEINDNYNKLKSDFDNINIEYERIKPFENENILNLKKIDDLQGLIDKLQSTSDQKELIDEIQTKNNLLQEKENELLTLKGEINEKLNEFETVKNSKDEQINKLACELEELKKNTESNNDKNIIPINNQVDSKVLEEYKTRINELEQELERKEKEIIDSNSNNTKDVKSESKENLVDSHLIDEYKLKISELEDKLKSSQNGDINVIPISSNNSEEYNKLKNNYMNLKRDYEKMSKYREKEVIRTITDLCVTKASCIEANRKCIEEKVNSYKCIS